MSTATAVTRAVEFITLGRHCAEVIESVRLQPAAESGSSSGILRVELDLPIEVDTGSIQIIPETGTVKDLQLTERCVSHEELCERNPALKDAYEKYLRAESEYRKREAEVKGNEKYEELMRGLIGNTLIESKDAFPQLMATSAGAGELIGYVGAMCERSATLSKTAAAELQQRRRELHLAHNAVFEAQREYLRLVGIDDFPRPVPFTGGRVPQQAPRVRSVLALIAGGEQGQREQGAVVEARLTYRQPRWGGLYWDGAYAVDLVGDRMLRVALDLHLTHPSSNSAIRAPWQNVQLSISGADVSQMAPRTSKLYVDYPAEKPQTQLFGATAVVHKKCLRKAHLSPVRGERADRDVPVTLGLTERISIPFDGTSQCVRYTEFETAAVSIYHYFPEADAGTVYRALVGENATDLVLPPASEGNVRVSADGRFLVSSHLEEEVAPGGRFVLYCGNDVLVKGKRLQGREMRSNVSRIIRDSEKQEVRTQEIELRNFRADPINAVVSFRLMEGNNQNLKVTTSTKFVREIFAPTDVEAAADYFTADGATSPSDFPPSPEGLWLHNKSLGTACFCVNLAPRQNVKTAFTYTIQYPTSQNLVTS